MKSTSNDGCTYYKPDSSASYQHRYPAHFLPYHTIVYHYGLLYPLPPSLTPSPLSLAGVRGKKEISSPIQSSPFHSNQPTYLPLEWVHRSKISRANTSHDRHTTTSPHTLAHTHSHTYSCTPTKPNPHTPHDHSKFFLMFSPPSPFLCFVSFFFFFSFTLIPSFLFFHHHHHHPPSFLIPLLPPPDFIFVLISS